MSNLRTHLKAKHTACYRKIEEDEKPSTAAVKQQPITTYFDSFTVSNFSRMNIVKGLLCLVTVNGRPFQCIDDEGLRIAFGPVLQRLNRKYSRHNIADLVQSAAEYIVGELTEKFKQGLVSVKIDGVSRFSRSFLGVNVQVS